MENIGHYADFCLDIEPSEISPEEANLSIVSRARAQRQSCLRQCHVTTNFWNRLEDGEIIGNRDLAFWRKLKTLSAQGMSIAALAIALGISRKTAARYLDMLGLRETKSNSRGKHVLALLQQGVARKAIMQQMEISQATLNVYIHRFKRSGALTQYAVREPQTAQKPSRDRHDDDHVDHEKRVTISERVLGMLQSGLSRRMIMDATGLDKRKLKHIIYTHKRHGRLIDYTDPEVLQHRQARLSRMAPARQDNPQREAVLQMLQQGLSRRVILSQVRIKRATLESYIKSFKRSGRLLAYADPDILQRQQELARILQMHLSGKTYRVISRELNFSETRVIQCIRRYRNKTRRTGRRTLQAQAPAQAQAQVQAPIPGTMADDRP